MTITSGQLDSFIADASLWVDNYLEDTCDSLDEDKLPTIEKYIAAHLFQMTQEGQTGPLASASRANISESYATRTGDNASRTSFIMTAAAFDPCGIVAEHWLGKRRARARVGQGYMT